MNKKLLQWTLGAMVMTVFLSTRAFAEQDYRERNIFNHITDGMVTMFKSSDLKQRIIDERIDLRAERRKTSAHKIDKDSDLEKNYNNHMNDINNKDAREKYENDRKAAMDAWQMKADQQKRDLSNERDADKKRIDNERADENRNYDKQKADINAQYPDSSDMKNAKLKEADDNHQIRMKDLDEQAKNDPAKYDAKEHDLNASLDNEKSSIEHQYDMRKEQLR